MKQLMFLQDKPKIGKKSEQLALNKNKGVQLYQRVDYEIQKKKQKIRKLKETVSSLKEREEQPGMEELLNAGSNKKLRDFSSIRPPEKSKGKPEGQKDLTPERKNRAKGKGSGGFDRPRSANEFYESIRAWTDKKNQHIAAQKIAKMTNERRELLFKPQKISKKRVAQTESLNGKPYERLYELAKERDENQQKLVEKYLNRTCPFKPKINNHTNRIIHKMEKRELIKETHKQAESAKQPGETLGIIPNKPSDHVYHSGSHNYSPVYNSKENYMSEGIMVSPFNPGKSSPSKYYGLKTWGGRQESPLDLSFGKNSPSKTQKVNVIQFEPEMDSILQKINSEKERIRSFTPQPSKTAGQANYKRNMEMVPEPKKYGVKREETPPKPPKPEELTSEKNSKSSSSMKASTTNDTISKKEESAPAKKDKSIKINMVKRKK